MSVPDEENLFGWEDDDYEDSAFSTNQENSFIMPTQNSQDPETRPNKKQKLSASSEFIEREFSTFMAEETSFEEITPSQQRRSVANLLFTQVSIYFYLFHIHNP